MDNLERYLPHRAYMQTMDCLQWRTNGIVGSIIRWKTGGYYNHTGAVVNFKFIDGDVRRWTLEAVGKGLMVNFLSTVLSAHDGEAWWYPLKSAFDTHRNAAAVWLMERAGSGYDYTSLIKNLAGAVSADAKALFCSEALFLAWHFRAVQSWAHELEHLRYKVDDEHKRALFMDVGMHQYYEKHYPQDRPKAPTPANVLEVLGLYVDDPVCVHKS